MNRRYDSIDVDTACQFAWHTPTDLAEPPVTLGSVAAGILHIACNLLLTAAALAGAAIVGRTLLGL